MKNIHILPTDKPSRLFKDDFDKYFISINIDQEQNHFKPQNIYITSDEEIKEGDWVFNFEYNYIVRYDSKKHDDKFWYKKIILTTDKSLDCVQPIDDEFLEWFVKNPSCEYVEIKMQNYYASGALQPNLWEYKIIIPQEESKQETPKKSAKNNIIEDWLKEHGDPEIDKKVECKLEQITLEEAAEKYASISFNRQDLYDGFIAGAKWQSERMCSPEEVKQMIDAALIEFSDYIVANIPNWFE
jgi:hypothetical protein